LPLISPLTRKNDINILVAPVWPRATSLCNCH